MLRIIGGALRGRTLLSAERPGLRPTADRVREALFDIIGSRKRFHDATVLELYAGTGALGLEALSRGAARCTFVEADAVTAGLIEKNIHNLGLENSSVLLREDAVEFAERVSEGYDIIFADPPYAATTFRQLVRTVFERGLLNPHGLFALEYSVMMIPPLPPKGAGLLVQREFGQTGVAVYGQVVTV